MKDVARAADMATGSIYYYYDGVDELLRHVHALAVDRYVTLRADAIATLDDPRAQLATMIVLGVPRPMDEPLSLALYQVEIAKARNAEHAAMITELCAAQRSMYESILDQGVARGLFTLVHPAADLAEQLISLEDGYGLGICAGKADYTHERTSALIMAAAEVWVGCPELARHVDQSVMDEVTPIVRPTLADQPGTR